MLKPYLSLYKNGWRDDAQVPIARDDLEDIWESIAAENPPAATRVAQILMQKCRMLADNPIAGRQRE